MIYNNLTYGRNNLIDELNIDIKTHMEKLKFFFKNSILKQEKENDFYRIQIRNLIKDRFEIESELINCADNLDRLELKIGNYKVNQRFFKEDLENIKII